MILLPYKNILLKLVYSSELISDTLEMINEGNKLSGGLTKVCSAVGLVGYEIIEDD